MATTEVGVTSQELNSTLLVGLGSAPSVTAKEIKDALEKGDNAARADALEKLIRLHVNGESQNHMIMTIIKFITPLDDHLIKKLVLYFWEVVDKTDKNGNLLDMIILICSFLRNDLQHPNEYVRGLTLRFLCKLKERDLIEPLTSAVLQNLTHRVTYVRRNAVLAVHSIYSRFPDLMPDAIDLVEQFLRDENDVSARRSAFDMLATFAPDRAARFLSDFRDANDLPEAGGVFLMSVVDFCRERIRANPYDRAKYVPILFSVLQTKSPAVRFQCANTLLSLSSSPTAIRSATLTFIDILKTHTDNSVRLIVVEQLDSMRVKFIDVLQDSLLDVLSALQDGSFEVRQKVVALAVELVTNKNIEAFIQAMKKELTRAQSDPEIAGDPAAAAEYKIMLVRAIRAALARYPKAASNTLPVLLEHLCDTSNTSTEVVNVIKEVLETQPELRRPTLTKLNELFSLLNTSSVLRAVLWIFGAYVASAEEALEALKLLKESMQPLPLTVPEAVAAAMAAAANGGAVGGDGGGLRSGAATPALKAVTTVREDGTYVTTYTTADAVTTAGGGSADGGDVNGMRAFIVRGDYFLAASLASTLNKLITQLFSTYANEVSAPTRNSAQADAMELLRDVLRYGTERGTLYPIDDDAQEHIRLSLTIIANPSSPFLSAVMKASTEALAARDRHEREQKAASEPGAAKSSDVQFVAIDAPVAFTQLSGGKDAVLEFEVGDETQASSGGEKGALDKTQAYLRTIEETVPLSGFSDPVYCEASVTVHQFEVSVDWLLVNRTSQQLQNVTIELASLGGMKLWERPQTYTLGPNDSLRVRTSLKVSATETGIIYGNVLYDAPNGERCCVYLNDIHVDIMNYIKPAFCTPADFREKWGAFDWENKITVKTDMRELRDYVEFVVRELNMQLLEALPEVDDAEVQSIPSAGDEEEDCEYVSCNLYARTVFGEDALANVSVERDSNGVISGVVRIRSNTQTIAYGIGEKLNMLQKSGKC